MKGYYLSQEELVRLREMRAEGLTCREVAEELGCSAGTVQKHSPGASHRQPIRKVREAFLRSSITASDVARALGWYSNDRPDSSRVKRTLGLMPDILASGKHLRETTDKETASRIMEAIGHYGGTEPDPEMLPAGPFLSWLEQWSKKARLTERGGARALAIEAGYTDHIFAAAKRTGLVSEIVVDKILTAAGGDVMVDNLYGPNAEIATVQEAPRVRRCVWGGGCRSDAGHGLHGRFCEEHAEALATVRNALGNGRSKWKKTAA